MNDRRRRTKTMVALLCIGLLCIACSSEKTESEATEPEAAETSKPSASSEPDSSPAPAEEGEEKGADAEPTPEPVEAVEPEVPAGPPDAKAIIQVAVADEASCALRADGRVLCWGSNEDHALGLPEAKHDALTPQLVPGIEDAVELWFGQSNSATSLSGNLYGTGSHNTGCARRRTGEVFCWGLDSGWVLSSGVKPSLPAPIGVGQLSGAAGIDFGGGTSCAATASGEVLCWGDHAFRALGRDFSGEEKLRGRYYGVGLVDAVTDAVQVAAGLNHTCARTSGGRLWCWGLEAVPGPVVDSAMTSKVIDVAAHTQTNQTCVVLDSGSTLCSDRLGPWQPVAGLGSTLDIEVGNATSCAIDTEGAVHCWCTTAYSFMGCETLLVPKPVVLPSKAVALAVDESHACAVLDTGELACWGGNRRGQLGDGTLQDRATPVLVSGLTAESTERSPMPEGVEQPPPQWPGAVTQRCGESVPDGEITYTPRTVLATALPGPGEAFSLRLHMTEDVFEVSGERVELPRPRGTRGLAAVMTLSARSLVMESADGGRKVWNAEPLTVGSYREDAALAVDIDAMRYDGNATLVEPRVELTAIDPETGFVCGWVDAKIEGAEQTVRGRFSATFSPSTERQEAPPPVRVSTFGLVGGGSLSAQHCTSGEVWMRYDGRPDLLALDAAGDQLALVRKDGRVGVLQAATADAGCELAPGAWGEGGYLLPEKTVQDVFIDDAGQIVLLEPAGRITIANADNTTTPRCQASKTHDLQPAPQNGVLFVKGSVQVLDAATCGVRTTIPTDGMGDCTHGAFVGDDRLALVCKGEDGTKLRLIGIDGSEVFSSSGTKSAGEADYLGPVDDLGACGAGVCVRKGKILKIWRGDGSFAGRVDLSELTGATRIADVAYGPDRVWVAATFQTSSSRLIRSDILALSGLPE